MGGKQKQRLHYDGLFDYTDGVFSGRCYLTLFPPSENAPPAEHEHVTVLLTEIGYPGRTVTNAIEAIASLVVHSFDLDPSSVAFVQCVPREGYFLVDFCWGRDLEGELRAAAPEWHPFTPTEIMLQRAESIIEWTATIPKWGKSH
jgi:hypothetical protein